MNIYEQLAKPFPANRVRWRVGATKVVNGKKKCKPLAYIDARDVMQRLDDVMGQDSWQAEYLPPTNGIVICRLGLRIVREIGEASGGVRAFDAPEWVWKSNGAGETQVEGEKGSCSDAFKRAAVLWGIGRYLYAIDSPWVEPDQYGKFTPPELPWWALPERYMEFLEKRKHA